MYTTIGRPSKEKSGFIIVPKGVTNNEVFASKLLGMDVAKEIEGDMCFGRISGIFLIKDILKLQYYLFSNALFISSDIYTGHDMTNHYCVAFIGTLHTAEMLLGDVLEANRLYKNLVENDRKRESFR